MNRPSSFSIKFAPLPGICSSGIGNSSARYSARSENSSEREWWPKTDTKADWGTPPTEERYETAKPNVVNMKPQNLVDLALKEIDIKSLPKAIKKHNEETIEVFFTSKKAYRMGKLPSETGVVRVAVDQIIVPTCGQPFNLYVNGTRDKFEILRENCADALEYGDVAEDGSKSVNVILDKKIEWVVRKLPDGGYEESVELTYTFPTSAKITFLVATTTDSSTPSQPLF